MYLNPFDGPRAKIQRSRAHFDELARAEANYREEQPLRVEFRPGPDGGTIVVAKADKLPTLEHATIVADILGNFRSSLDIAVCEAARMAGIPDPSDTYFHFGKTEKNWDDGVKKRMKHAPPDIRAVVRSLQPWENGNRLLWAMSKLAAKDKHRLLIPLVGGTNRITIDGLRVDRVDGRRSTRVDPKLPHWNRNLEAEILHVEGGSKVAINGPTVLEARFAFGDVDAVAHQPVIRVLHQMGSICENATGTVIVSRTRGPRPSMPANHTRST